MFSYQGFEPPDRTVIILVVEVVEGLFRDRVVIGMDKTKGSGGVPLRSRQPPKQKSSPGRGPKRRIEVLIA